MFKFFKTKSNLQFLFEGLAVLGLIISLIMQYQVDLKQYKWNKKVETLHYLQETEEKRQKLRFLSTEVNLIKSSDSLIKRFNQDTIFNANIIERLNLYESIAIGYTSGIFDLEVINNSIGTGYTNFYSKVKPIIEFRRLQKKAPSLFNNYQRTVEDLNATYNK